MLISEVMLIYPRRNELKRINIRTADVFVLISNSNLYHSFTTRSVTIRAIRGGFSTGLNNTFLTIQDCSQLYVWMFAFPRMTQMFMDDDFPGRDSFIRGNVLNYTHPCKSV